MRRCSPTQARSVLSPGTPETTNAGEPRAAPPWELCLRRELAADPRSLSPGRPIGKQRPGLGRGLIRSEPLEQDPTAEIWRYRFALAVLLKSPWAFGKSTRGPQPFKNNYRFGLFYSLKPLSFPKLVPTVQRLFFYELDPGVNG